MDNGNDSTETQEEVFQQEVKFPEKSLQSPKVLTDMTKADSQEIVSLLRVFLFLTIIDVHYFSFFISFFSELRFFIL